MLLFYKNKKLKTQVKEENLKKDLTESAVQTVNPSTIEQQLSLLFSFFFFLTVKYSSSIFRENHVGKVFRNIYSPIGGFSSKEA